MVNSSINAGAEYKTKTTNEKIAAQKIDKKKETK